MYSALVTGANGGIGLALCRAFSKAGYFVIGTDRGDKACVCDAYIKLDLSLFVDSAEQRNRFVDSVRSLDKNAPLKTLVNNAAVQLIGGVAEIGTEDFDLTLDINLKAPFLLTQCLLPSLELNAGSVVNIGSIHAQCSKPGFVSYATSKSALLGLTQAMAVDLGNRIRLNIIQPAATETKMLLEGFAGKEEKYGELKAVHPLGRIASPDEIANIAVFLASEQASFMTGACINVDGGVGVRLHDPD